MSHKFGEILREVAFVKSIYFNLKAFDFKTAVKCPVIIGRHTQIHHLKRGCIELPDKIYTGMIKIGIGGTYGTGIPGGGIQNRINIADDGKVIFRGKALFRKGCAILVRGEFDIGDRFSSNRDCSFSCNDRIVIGNDCMLGWNIHVRDSDNHPIYYDDVRTEDSKPVIIGDHVWICSEAHVLKGTVIPDNCVVGYKAVVSKKFEEKNALIVGFPAQVKRTNIRWEH